MGWEPWSCVIGGESCSEGHGFESQYCILDGYFFTFICSKNSIACLKRQNQKKKRPGMAYFLKNNQDGSKAAIQQASMYYNRKWMTGCDADKTFLKMTQRKSDEQIKMSSHLGAVERVNCSQLKGIAAAWVHV